MVLTNIVVQVFGAHAFCQGGVIAHILFEKVKNTKKMLVNSFTKNFRVFARLCLKQILLKYCLPKNKPEIMHRIFLIQLLIHAMSTTSMVGQSTEIATFGGGCFWCIEAAFENVKGVLKAESGYMGGGVMNPSYEAVCSGVTGHAEVVQVTYNPQQVSLIDLLEVFFLVHDPTTLNRQGADVGTQYRSVLFYHTPDHKKVMEQVIKQLEGAEVYDTKIVTAIEPAVEFYRAENYHQEYFSRNSQQPYCRMVIHPKIEKLQKELKRLLK
jgi:peptide-methionine (S)-S-oxide reductase